MMDTRRFLAPCLFVYGRWFDLIFSLSEFVMRGGEVQVPGAVPKLLLKAPMIR